MGGGHSLPAPSAPNNPNGSESKESDCNVGALGSIPGLGRSPGEGNSNPLQYSGLENSTDRRTCQAIVHRVAESDRTEQISLSLFKGTLNREVRNAKLLGIQISRNSIISTAVPHQPPFCPQQPSWGSPVPLSTPPLNIWALLPGPGLAAQQRKHSGGVGGGQGGSKAGAPWGKKRGGRKEGRKGGRRQKMNNLGSNFTFITKINQSTLPP